MFRRLMNTMEYQNRNALKRESAKIQTKSCLIIVHQSRNLDVQNPKGD